jgi:hypothetical protein
VIGSPPTRTSTWRLSGFVVFAVEDFDFEDFDFDDEDFDDVDFDDVEVDFGFVVDFVVAETVPNISTTDSRAARPPIQRPRPFTRAPPRP